MKVHVLGGPGSGKTTLAGAIASTFHVPHHDLDLIGWDKHGMNLAADIDDAIALANQPAWVAEGVYLLWVDPLLDQADAVVMLATTWPVAAWRIVRRHVVKSAQGTNRYPGIRPLIDLLGYAHSYYQNIHRAEPPTAALARQFFDERRARCEPPTPAALCQRFATYRELAIPPTQAFAHEYLEAYPEKVWRIHTLADRERLLSHLTSAPLGHPSRA